MRGGRGGAAQTAQPRPDHSAGAEKAAGRGSLLVCVGQGRDGRPMNWKRLQAGCIDA